MAELTDIEFDVATERGRCLMESVPLALSARYDPMADRIVIDLNNGCTFAFPPRIAQGLEEGTPKQLANIEISGSGYGLHWEDLDVDFTVPGLVNGIFGTQAYMARRAGQRTSPAKAAAARANGAKGGRPRKTATA